MRILSKEKYREWHKWYAWYPVLVWHGRDGIAWLETVWRVYNPSTGWLYSHFDPNNE